MGLHNLNSSTDSKKRVGRGGKRGKTSGKGMKGQKARAGGTPRPAYRDVIKKIPKLRGHGVNRARTINPNSRVTQAITIRSINKAYKTGEVVSLQTLLEKGLMDRGVSAVKIIATGDLDASKKLTIDDSVVMTAGAKAKLS